MNEGSEMEAMPPRQGSFQGEIIGRF